MRIPSGHDGLTLQYVMLADLERLQAAQATGLTDTEIVRGLLLFVMPLVDLDDYVRFIDDVRAAPDTAWIGAADPPGSTGAPRRLAS